MSEVQRLANAQGEMELWQPMGFGKFTRTTGPTNGFVGAAPGCEWVNASTGQRFLNAGTSASAVWIENDQLVGSGIIFGSGGNVTANSLVMLASGNVARDIGSAAGKSPSANSLDKIFFALWIPANTFDAAGRGFQVSVYGTAAATANNKEFKVILGATNTTFPTLPAVDGSVTVSGGTVIGDTGVLVTNNGAIILFCQIFKRGVANSNTQESMTTGIIGGATHGGAGKWTDQTFTENANNLLVITGQTTTATTDLIYNGSEVTAYN